MQHKAIKYIFTLCSCFIISNCSAPVHNSVQDEKMSCEQIRAEMEKLNIRIANRQTNKEATRVVDTGTTVAVQGASMAGVPYIGGIFSIGKTLANHNKQTANQNSQYEEQRISDLYYLADSKGCINHVQE